MPLYISTVEINALLAQLNPPANDGLMTPITPTFYLVKFSTAVLLSLRDVKDLVHVGFPLLACDSGEQQAGYEEVGAAQSSENVAFKFLHV